MDMANASSTISVGVNLQLQNLQDTVKQMQNAMKGVKVDSSAYKEMNKYLQEAQKKLLDIATITEKPITTEGTFKAIQKDIDKLQENLTKLGLKMSDLGFKDLELFPNEKAKLSGITKEIDNTKKHMSDLKKSVRDNLLKDSDLKGFVDNIKVGLSGKDFDEIYKKIEQKLNSLVERTRAAQERLNSLNTPEQKNINEGLDIANGVQQMKGKSLKEMLPKNISEQYLTSDGAAFKRNGEKEAFTQRLVDLGIIPSDAELDKIKKLSTIEMAKYLSGLDLSGYIKEQTKKSKRSDIERAYADLAAAQGEEKKARSVYSAFSGADQSIKITAEADASKIQALEASLAQARQEITAMRNELNEFKSGSPGMTLIGQQADDLRESVEGSARSFNNLNQTMGTFDKLKGTIASFMGFGQVMRIVQNAVRNAINHIKELDAVMNQIAVVTDFSQDELWDQISSYSAIAKQYAVSIQGVYQVSQIYY